MKYRKKPVVIEATQWFKNGDHPLDYEGDTQGFEGGVLRTFTGSERKSKKWEGVVVRYFRHPAISGTDFCKGVDRQNNPIGCGRMFHDHGWIDTLEGGHKVCPGDWIITGVKGEFYPCKPDIFAATYEPVSESESASSSPT